MATINWPEFFNCAIIQIPQLSLSKISVIRLHLHQGDLCGLWHCHGWKEHAR